MASREPNVIRGVLEMMVGVLILVANISLIATIMQLRRLHTRSNILILSLAFSDVIVGCLILAASFFWLSGERDQSVFCAAFLAFADMAAIATMLHMVLIAIDRYIYISDPLKYEMHWERWRLFTPLAIVWTIAILLSLRPALANIFEPELGCEAYRVFPDAMTFYASFVLYVVCVVPAGVLHCSIVRMLVTKRIQIGIMERKPKRRNSKRESVAKVSRRYLVQFVKSYRIFLYLYLLFLLCYTPSYVGYFVCHMVTTDNDKHHNLIRIFDVILHLNSALNVLMYMWCNPALFKGLGSELCRTKRSLAQREPSTVVSIRTSDEDVPAKTKRPAIVTFSDSSVAIRPRSPTRETGAGSRMSLFTQGGVATFAKTITSSLDCTQSPTDVTVKSKGDPTEKHPSILVKRSSLRPRERRVRAASESPHYLRQTSSHLKVTETVITQSVIVHEDDMV